LLNRPIPIVPVRPAPRPKPEPEPEPQLQPQPQPQLQPQPHPAPAPHPPPDPKPDPSPKPDPIPAPDQRPKPAADDKRKRTDVLFGQARMDPGFSVKDKVPKEIAGKTLRAVADMLRTGALSPDVIVVQYFRSGEHLVAINNRGLAALSLAGLKPTRLI